MISHLDYSDKRLKKCFMLDEFRYNTLIRTNIGYRPYRDVIQRIDKGYYDIFLSDGTVYVWSVGYGKSDSGDPAYLVRAGGLPQWKE